MRNLNTVQCGCKKPKCQIGIRFDSNPKILLFQDKYGKDSLFLLTKTNTKSLIEELQAINFNENE